MQHPSITMLNQLIAAQSMLYVFRHQQNFSDFIAQTILSVPAVKECTVCFLSEEHRHRSVVHLKKCGGCPAFVSKAPLSSDFACPLENAEDAVLFPFSNDEQCFGYIALIADDENIFDKYKPMIGNLCSSITLTLENLIQKEKLHKHEQQLEELVRERTEELEKIVAEKDLLLKEVHHRVKNNFNVVISLLNMQMNTVRDESAREALSESMTRVQAMASIHEFLYKSEHYSFVQADKFFPEILTALPSSLNGAHLYRLHQDIDAVELPIDIAIPCSLIISELITNCVKHAFPGDSADGTIDFTLKAEPGKNRAETKIRLGVKDNGLGLPEDSNLEESDTLGMKIIRALTAQIKGTLNIETGTRGTSVQIEFLRHSKTVSPD